jgi:hypothetical protein
MKLHTLTELLKLRLLVGFLGENTQKGWWQTAFIGQTASSFLSHIYPRTILLSQFHGVTEAARRIHDERIGVGSVFHLFRLPEEIEQDLHHMLQKGEFTLPADLLGNEIASIEELTRIGGDTSSFSEGPVRVGSSKDILTAPMIKELAKLYSAAFAQGSKTFPYFVS